MSSAPIIGKSKAGRPWGRAPTTGTPARVDRSSTVTARVAPATAISTPGRRGLRRSTSITASAPTPSASAAVFVRPASTPCTKARAPPTTPSPSTEKPNSGGSWLTSTVRAMPFM